MLEAERVMESDVRCMPDSALMPLEVEEELPGAMRVEEQGQPQEVQAPRAPTMEEERRHALTHLPFAPWRKRCVLSKAHDDPHISQDVLAKTIQRVEVLPIIQCDFMYLDGMTALTAYSLEKGAGAATVVPTKGVGDMFQVTWLVRALHWMGHRHVVLQCD